MRPAVHPAAPARPASRTIRTLDDLPPASGRILADSAEQPVTLILGTVHARPFQTTGFLAAASLQSRPPGGVSPWRLEIELRAKPDRIATASYSRPFPESAVILIGGKHRLDLTTPAVPPLDGTAPEDEACAIYATAWDRIARLCREAAGPDQILIDTTAAAIAWHRARVLEGCHAQVA
jgi:hypothetical protein